MKEKKTKTVLKDKIKKKTTPKKTTKKKENILFTGYDKDYLKILLENTEDTIYLKDLKSRFLLVNNAQLKVLNAKDVREVIGKTDFDYFNKEHAEAALDDEQKILKTGKPLIAKTEHLITVTGEQRIFSATKVPILDKKGKPVGILGISRDITNIRLAEDSLSVSENQFKLIWEKSFNGMRIMDENGVVELVNESFCKMVDKKREEMEGKHFTIVYQSSQAKEMMEKQKERLLTNSIETQFERELTLWNGNSVVFLLSNTILELPQNRRKIVSIFQDMTKRRKAEQNLKKINDELEERVKQRTNELAQLNIRLKQELLEKAKFENELKMNYREMEMNKILLEQDEKELKQMNERLIDSEIQLRKSNANKYLFLSLMSDEMREPFDNLISLCEKLLKETEDRQLEDIKNSIFVLFGSIKNLNDFLENIMFWLRLQTGKFEFKPRLLNLNRTLSGFLKEFQIYADIKNINLNNFINEDAFVYADEELLKSIFLHIITNGIKFSNHGTEINIYSVNFNEYEEITVEDNGIGIDTETQKKLFRFDVRLKSKGTDDEKGRGLGLILCKEMIEKHNGYIKIESELGKGTKVKFGLRRRNQ